MLDTSSQFLSSEQPSEPKSLDVALNIARVEKIRSGNLRLQSTRRPFDKVVRNSFMARANWVLINKPNLARAVDAHAQMLILSCRNFGVFITLIAHISASARWIFFIFSVITRINWLHT